MFASMLEAADYCMVMAYPDEATGPYAGRSSWCRRDAAGRRVNPNWDTLGMRATRSDALILEDCRLPDDAVGVSAPTTSGSSGSPISTGSGDRTPRSISGVARRAYDELRRAMQTRRPEGYAQPLAYHPDVRRHVAELSADLEAARLITYRSAWLSDSEGPTPETTAALFRAKYMVGVAASRITRVALTLGGAHGIFKGSRIEQLFRDGALAEIQPPPADFCLYIMGLHELGLDPAEILPPMKPG